jgi:hypothetical protein
MDKEDVTILIASIRNAIYHKNFLVAMTKLVELKKMLNLIHLESKVEALIGELGRMSREPHPDTDLLDAKLKELDAQIL